MAYQEVTTTSYGQRLKNSAGGIFTGFLMFLAGTALLWWNEGRAVKTTKMLEEAQGNYVEMENIKAVDPQFDGKLVHATGFANTTDTLVDPIFGVKDLALSMNRKVEYYQWEEHSKEEKRDKLGGGEETITTYTYRKAWTTSPQESSAFHDPQYQRSNFVLMEVDPGKMLSHNVTFGAYVLTESQVDKLPDNKVVNVSIPEETLVSLDRDLIRTANNSGRVGTVSNGYGISANTTTDSLGRQQYHATMVHTNGNIVYLGPSASSPNIGDVKITFTKAEPTNVSLLARVSGNTFSKYVAKNGKSFSSISVGTKSADEMFQTEHDNNTMMAWLLRLAGLCLVVAGLKGIFGFLETILKVVPLFSYILGFGINIICAVIGFVWSLIVFAIAWLFYRPVLSVILLVVAALVIFAFSKKGKKLIAQHITKASPASPQPSPIGEGAVKPQQPVQPQQPAQSQQLAQPQQPARPQESADEAWT